MEYQTLTLKVLDLLGALPAARKYFKQLHSMFRVTIVFRTTGSSLQGARSDQLKHTLNRLSRIPPSFHVLSCTSRCASHRKLLGLEVLPNLTRAWRRVFHGASFCQERILCSSVQKRKGLLMRAGLVAAVWRRPSSARIEVELPKSFTEWSLRLRSRPQTISLSIVSDKQQCAVQVLATTCHHCSLCL